MELQPQVTVEQVCFVKANHINNVDHIDHMLYMSGIDMLLRFTKPSRTLLFYPNCSDPMISDDDPQQLHNIDVDHAFEALRRGLAATLVPYYPFAGRLAHLNDYNGACAGRLVLHCNDAGVELIRARCDDIPFSDLTSHSFTPRPFFRQLVPMDHLRHSNDVEAPIVSVQLTAFHGGLTVGIANQHSVADGFTFWMFVKALSQACRGEQFTLLPLHYRTLLKPETVMLNKFLPMPTSPLKQQQDVARCWDNSYSYRLDDDHPECQNIQLVVHFSKEMVDTLKKTCIATSSDQKSFTTYEALSAYLWKRYIMAKGLDNREPVQFLQVLDIRHRMVPPLTSLFCGNAIAPFYTISTAKEVKEESLGATAGRIRQTIWEVDDYSIKKLLAELEKPDLFHIPVINLFRIRNARRFPVYEAGDFGWGVPAAVRPPISDTEGEVTWYPGKKPGSIDVAFALLDTVCSRFFSPDLYVNDPLDVSLLAPNHLIADW